MASAECASIRPAIIDTVGAGSSDRGAGEARGAATVSQPVEGWSWLPKGTDRFARQAESSCKDRTPVAEAGVEPYLASQGVADRHGRRRRAADVGARPQTNIRPSLRLVDGRSRSRLRTSTTMVPAPPSRSRGAARCAEEFAGIGRGLGPVKIAGCPFETGPRGRPDGCRPRYGSSSPA